MAKAISAKTKGRLTKKELKQDKLVEFAYKAERFYLEHQKWVIGVAVAVVAVVIAYFVIDSSLRSGRREANYQLTMAKMTYGSGRYEDARNQFQQIVSSRGGRIAAEAKYFVGRIALEQGDFAGAESEFKAYISGFSGDDYLNFGAKTGLAAAVESQGRLEEAAELYVKAAIEYSKLPGSAQALMEAARIYLKLNQKDKLKEVYQEIRDKHPKSTHAAIAKRELETMN